MASPKAEESSSQKYVYYNTKNVFEECCFAWTLENLNFVMLGETYGYIIKSPIFPSDDKNKCKWELLLYPCGFDAQHSDLITVSLTLKSTTAPAQTKIKTKCNLTFHDVKDNKLDQVLLETVFDSPASGKKLDARVNRESLFKKNLLGDDSLKIKVKINSVVGFATELYENDECYGKVKPELKLIDDLSAMFLEQKFSDVVIVVKGTDFQAHQNIIGARCPVLGAMLTHDTKEKQQKRIVISDVDPEIMQKLLCFMYTSLIEFTNTDIAAKVLIAADKYAIEDLKLITEEYLSFNINISNALDILSMADVHSALKLKTRAIDFICKNRESFSSVSKYSPNCLKNPELLVEILATLASDVKTDKPQK